jgi:putative restriction endonuclease
MTDADVLLRFDSLRQHQQDGKRSPHKPLLVLTALGRLVANGSSATPFSAVEQRLSGLVAAFGRPAYATRATAAAYPFTRLRADGVWKLSSDVPMDSVTPLRERDVVGSFTPDIERALTADPDLVRQLAHRIVVSQFPPTLAGDVLAQAGLDPTWATDITLPQSRDVRRRTAAWVREVLLAWDLTTVWRSAPSTTSCSTEEPSGSTRNTV